MASADNSTSSGDVVSKLESDVGQTITLAGAVIQLIREPVTAIYQNVAKSKDLKRSVGHWEKEAYDDKKQCKIPILNLTEFEDYIAERDGHLKPEGKCTASGCWAYLLHALGIRPGMRVLGWKPVVGGSLTLQNGGIEMDIEGAVICHILNIYQTRDTWDSYDTRVSASELLKKRTLPFGQLAWDNVEDEIHMHFKPNSESSIESERWPFGRVGRLMEPGTLWVAYLNALDYGISDPKYIWPAATAHLSERIGKLLLFRENLKSPGTPLLIMHEWLEGANRIKKRVLTDGGNNESFFGDIASTIRLVVPPPETEYWVSTLRSRFLLDDQGFAYATSGNIATSIPDEKVLHQSIRQTLHGYSNEPTGTWKRNLHDIGEDVLTLALIPLEFYIHSIVWICDFGRRSSLWNERIQLGASILGCSSVSV